MKTAQRTRAKTVQKTVERQKLDEFASVLRASKTKREAKRIALFAALFGAAVVGRVALQGVPSVEPIIPLAVMAGLLFGATEGAMLGGSAYVVSNFFVWGLQGPWSVFQALAAAVGGAIAGIYGKMRKAGFKEYLLLSVLATALFEVVVTLSGAMLFGSLFGAVGLAVIPLYIATSLPFAALHLSTNMVFSRMAKPLLKWRKPDAIQVVSVSRTDNHGRTSVRMYRIRDY